MRIICASCWHAEQWKTRLPWFIFPPDSICSYLVQCYRRLQLNCSIIRLVIPGLVDSQPSVDRGLILRLHTIESWLGNYICQITPRHRTTTEDRWNARAGKRPYHAHFKYHVRIDRGP